jgi:hypothetical protein
VEALIWAVVISIGSGLIVGAIILFITENEKRRRLRRISLIALTGVVLLALLGIYSSWPNLVTVPSLQGLSQAQAEDLIRKQGLHPDATTQYSSEVSAGLVVPGSQYPPPDLVVRKGTHVTFAINAQRVEVGISLSDSHSNPTVSLLQPQSGGELYCTRGGNGIYTSIIRGGSSGTTPDQFRLLLWLQPVNPRSDRQGWYLQRSPNGVISPIEPDGSWTGVIQIGNAAWPPKEGHKFNVAVSVADIETANRLMGEVGEVMRMNPVGLSSSIASNVVASLQQEP